MQADETSLLFLLSFTVHQERTYGRMIQRDFQIYLVHPPVFMMADLELLPVFLDRVYTFPNPFLKKGEG
jgi:hypothetical protein